MLSRNSRKIFALIKQTENKQYAYFDLKKELGWDHDAVRSACQQLINSGLAIETEYSPMPGHRLPWGIVLTEEGRHSKKYFWAKAGAFLFKSIAVPIAVAAITAFITALITAKIVAGN